MASAQKFGLTTKKAVNFSDWYVQMVVQSELLDYYEIKGCFILRPSAMHIWSSIRRYIDNTLVQMGVDECSFPLLVTRKNLEREKSHLSNFDPELAWITRCGDKVLDEPVALRPTSETIMYPSYARWISSHRDLPLRLNQWCSVLRWEVRSTLPFIRGREFLWQEGHMAYYSRAQAEEETLAILRLYEEVYRCLLAVPVFMGRKSRKETFGGAEYTLSVEAFIPGSGKSIQAATSHYLGQNFAKIFDIKTETEMEGGEKEYVYQNSWGLTTRSIGIAAMVHSDDFGFVCPPRVSKIQAVVVMCGINATSTSEQKKKLLEYTNSVVEAARKRCRVHFDDRTHVSPGFKYNHWEIRGVPLRIEVGFRDMAAGTVCVVRRDNRDKKTIKREMLDKSLSDMIDEMHEDMYTRACVERDRRTRRVEIFSEFLECLEERCLGLIPWCQEEVCETEITEKTTVKENGMVVVMGAKSLCTPMEVEECINRTCINCGKNAVSYTLFGRSY